MVYLVGILVYLVKILLDNLVEILFVYLVKILMVFLVEILVYLVEISMVYLVQVLVYLVEILLFYLVEKLFVFCLSGVHENIIIFEDLSETQQRPICLIGDPLETNTLDQRPIRD